MGPSRTTAAAALAAAVVGVLAVAPPALAAFTTAPATATASFGTGTLAPPTGVGVQRTCTTNVVGVTVLGSATVRWTPSATSWATGQTVVLDGPSGRQSQSLGPTASSATFTLGLLSAGSYSVSVRTTYASWSASAAPAAFTC